MQYISLALLKSLFFAYGYFAVEQYFKKENSSDRLFLDLEFIKSITYKNKVQENGRSRELNDIRQTQRTTSKNEHGAMQKNYVRLSKYSTAKQYCFRNN